MRKLLLFVYIFLSYNLHAADFYWIGGTGTWNDPGHWSLSDGGISAGSIPGSTDDVYFTALSGILPSSLITLTANATSTCRDLYFQTGISGYQLTGATTARFDLNGSAYLEPNMNITWAGEWWLYQSATGATHELHTGNNEFRNNLIRFERPSSGTGGSFLVTGTFRVLASSAAGNLRRLIINLLDSTQEVDFSNSTTFPIAVDLVNGRVHTRLGYNQQLNVISGAYPSANIDISPTAILLNYGPVVSRRLTIRGEARLNADLNPAGYELDYFSIQEGVNGAYPFVLDFRHCHIRIRQNFDFGGSNNATAANREVLAQNSTLHFLPSASHFRLSGHQFHYVRVDEGLTFLSTFNFLLSGTNINHEPRFWQLSVNRNAVFTRQNNSPIRRFFIEDLLRFTAGHRYSSEMNRHEFVMLSGSTLDMRGDCGQPIWLENTTFDLNQVGTMQLSHLLFEGSARALPIAAPSSAGPGSFPITGVVTEGWQFPPRQARTLVWIGPIPSDINNTASYGVWYDEQNWYEVHNLATWSSNPLIAPGNPGLGGAVCPPTEIDSVIFPNLSYTNADQAIMYSEGMRWLGEGCIVGIQAQKLEIWGALHFHPFMQQSFNGTVRFRSNRPYRCHIETANHNFLAGLVFNSENGQGEWLLLDSLKAPNRDIEASVDYNETQVSIGIRSGHLHTAAIACDPNTSQVIRAWGMALNHSGQLSLYASRVHIDGQAQGNGSSSAQSRVNFRFQGGVLHAGSSHIIFQNRSNQSNFGFGSHFFPKAILGSHTYYDISCLKPVLNTPNASSHILMLAANARVHRMQFGAETWPVVQSMANAGASSPHIQKIESGSLFPFSIGSGIQLVNNSFAVLATRELQVDSMVLSGDLRLGIGLRVYALLDLPNSSVFTLSSSAITLRLNAPHSYTSPHPICPLGSLASTLSYPGAQMSLNGSCLGGNAFISGGQIIAESPLGFSGTYLSISDNIVTGPQAPFNLSNSLLNGTTTGWTGSMPPARLLRWVDTSNLAGNTASWQDGNYWEQVLPSYAPAPQCPPTRIDTVLFDDNSFSAANQQVELLGVTDIASMYWRNIPLGRNPVLLGATTQTLTLRASLEFHQNMINSHAGFTTFSGRPSVDVPTFHILSNGISFSTGRITFQGEEDGSTWLLLDDFQQQSATFISPNEPFRLDRGRLLLQGHSLTIPGLRSSSNSSRLLDIRNASIFLTMNSTVGSSAAINIAVWIVNNSSNGLQILADSSRIIATRATAMQRFVLGDHQYNYIEANTRNRLRVETNQTRVHYFNWTANNSTYPAVSFVNGSGSYFVRFDANGPIHISTPEGSYDTLQVFHNAAFNTSNRYFGLLHFEPGRNYTLQANTVQWIQNSGTLSLNGQTPTGIIQFYGQPTGSTAYIRKDSAFLCADYVNIRDVWAVGNGNNPLSCESFTNLGINTNCAHTNPWIVSACDTITDLASNCGPWTNDPADALRGRADFNAGAFADLQGGNVFGWAKRPYPTLPKIELESYATTQLCQDDTLVYRILIQGELPFDITGTWALDAVPMPRSWSINQSSQLQGGSGQVGDPYILLDTITVPALSNRLEITDLTLSVERCFNNIYTDSLSWEIDFLHNCNVLALNQLLFQAQKQGDKALLKWSWENSNSKHARYFRLERSADAQNWRVIHHREAESASEQYYLDTKASSFGTWYYRLLVETWQGQIAHSPLAALTWNGEEALVYPNPSTGLFFIPQLSKNSPIRLFDSYGRQLPSSMYYDELLGRLDLSDYPSGVYILQIGDSQQKLIIAR